MVSSAPAADAAAPSLPTEGRLGHLTPAQETALEELRIKILHAGLFDPARHNDYTLLRFLRARQFDVARAFAMFSDCEKWRAETKVEEMCAAFTFDEAAAVTALYPQYYHGTDKLGRPLYIEQFSTFDTKKLLACTTMERMVQRLIVEYERMLKVRMPACSLAAGVHIEQSCTVIDLKGVSLWDFTKVVSFVQQVSKIGQNYYPEIMGRMFVTNAPGLFSTAWSVVRKFLDEATVRKISILDSSSTLPKLLEVIDKTNLPESLGGTCACKERGVLCTDADIGPWNTQPPERILEYYNSDVERLKKWAQDNQKPTEDAAVAQPSAADVAAVENIA